MSILITGMEMPTSCSVCPMLEGDRLDGLCHAASKWLDDDEHWTWFVFPEGDMDDSKPCNCPLVPVPKHGRLIDADAFFDDLLFPSKQFEQGMRELIGDAPTVIPAEERPAEDTNAPTGLYDLLYEEGGANTT